MSGNGGLLNNSEVIDLLLTVFEMCYNIYNKDSNGLDKLNKDLTKSYLKSDADPVMKAAVIDFSKVASKLTSIIGHKYNDEVLNILTSTIHSMAEQNEIDINLITDKFPEIKKLLLSFMKEYSFECLVNLCDVYPKWLRDNTSKLVKEDLERHRSIFNYLTEIKKFDDTYLVFDKLDEEINIDEDGKKIVTELLRKSLEIGMLNDDFMKPVCKKTKHLNKSYIFEICNII